MEADYGLTQFAFDSERSNQYSADDKLIVNFRMQPHINKVLSAQEGRPIFEPKEYVTIIVPGDKNNIVNRPVWSLDKTRFSRQYAAFKNNQTQETTGTPLETVPWITREQVEELKFFHIRTLEQLSNCPDVHAQKFMGINKLRQRARDHIEMAKVEAPKAALADALRQIEELRASVAKLTAEKEEEEA